MNRYQVKPTAPEQAGAEILHIETYPWDEAGYRPPTWVRMTYGPTCFTVCYETVEQQLRTEARGLSSLVCEDSAVELFLMPNPERSSRYVNLEFNALCATCVCAGTGRADSVLLREEELLQFEARSEISLCPEGYRWRLTAQVPYAFLQRHTDCGELGPGSRMRANFYKIAEAGPLVHFGCWNPIDWPEPDFHRPEFFGELVLV